MDITVGYEPASGSSILSGPASFNFRGIGANWEHMCFASMSKQFESAILHQLGALANVVIAAVWRTDELGSIPRGTTIVL